MTGETRWQRWFVYGKLRFIGQPLYTSMIAAELVAARALDDLRPRRKPNDQSPILENLTAIIKTFERPKILRRLLASIKRLYPELKIIVADDSRQPIELDDVQVIALPYDSGIAAGRNAGLKQAATKYVLILDDDFVFYRATQLESALLTMEQHSEIDIMGGEVIYLPLFKKLGYRHEFIFPTEALPTQLPGSRIAGLPVYDKVPNFFIARAERLQIVGWDPNLKKLEHADFFTRAKGVLTTVFNAELKCLHARTPFDSAYMQHRNDIASSEAILDEKYGKNQ